MGGPGSGRKKGSGGGQRKKGSGITNTNKAAPNKITIHKDSRGRNLYIVKGKIYGSKEDAKTAAWRK